MSKWPEVQFQRMFIKELKDNECRVKKMQSGMGYTVVDLYIRYFSFAYWVELKTISSVRARVPLTRLQRNDLIEEIEAGGCAACLVAIKEKETENVHIYTLDLNKSEPRLTAADFICTRPRGGEFNIMQILSRISADSERLRIRKPSP